MKILTDTLLMLKHRPLAQIERISRDPVWHLRHLKL